MKKGRPFVGGVICLALAAALGVLSFVVPVDSPILGAGEQNLRWVPAVILGIAGIVQVATAGISRQR
jgi:hypothetical protein